MGFSDHLLEEGSDLWEAQKNHPFVTELATGTLDQDAFQYWIEQDYRYLLDWARAFAVAGARARDEETMTDLLTIGQRTLAEEMDLHREFAAQYGIDREQLAAVRKAPTTQAYTNFLLRTAYEGSVAEAVAALYPCGQGFLDVAEHAAELADVNHRYTPWIETYTGEAFQEVVTTLRRVVDRYGEHYPGAQDAMREAFLTATRLEHEFWEMAYTQEGWSS
ncbi:MAG: thiaminase II [Halorhabdus sp.]